MGSRILLLLFVIPVLVSNIQCWQHASEADLLQAIQERTKSLLVTYVFSFEGTSQDLERHWEKIDNAIRKQGIDVQVGSINCSASLTTCLDLDVKAYPAIRFYHPDGRIIRYRGPRKPAPILSFLRRATRPAITNLSTPEELAGFITTDDIVFTAQLTRSEAPLYEDHFRHLAHRYHDRYSFGVLTQRSYPDKVEEEESTIRCHNNPNSETFTLTSRDLPLANSLTELLSQCTAPLIYEPIGRKELAELATFSSQNSKSGLIVHFFTKPTSSSSTSAPELDLVKDDYKKEILPLAKKYAGEILFTIIDGDEHPGMGPAVGGLPPDAASGVSIENVRTGELFPYLHRKISASRLEEFLGGVLRGTVKPWDGQTVLYVEAGGADGESAGWMGHDEL